LALLAGTRKKKNKSLFHAADEARPPASRKRTLHRSQMVKPTTSLNKLSLYVPLWTYRSGYNVFHHGLDPA